MLSNIFFSTLKDAIFIASYLETHLLALGGGAMEFIWGWNIFQKFLNKLMFFGGEGQSPPTLQVDRTLTRKNFLLFWERDFGGWKYFSKISYLPSPIESQLDSPINAVFALHHR